MPLPFGDGVLIAGPALRLGGSDGTKVRMGSLVCVVAWGHKVRHSNSTKARNLTLLN